MTELAVGPGAEQPTPEQIEAARALIASVAAKAPVPEEKGPCLAFRAWEKAQCMALTTLWSTWGCAACAARALKGVRTLLFFTVTAAGALFSSIEGIDLSGIASKLTGLKIEYTDLLLGISVIGFLLRLVTDSSAFKRWKKAARGDGEAPGIGSGDVDEPEEAA